MHSILLLAVFHHYFSHHSLFNPHAFTHTSHKQHSHANTSFNQQTKQPTHAPKHLCRGLHSPLHFQPFHFIITPPSPSLITCTTNSTHALVPPLNQPHSSPKNLCAVSSLAFPASSHAFPTHSPTCTFNHSHIHHSFFIISTTYMH